MLDVNPAVATATASHSFHSFPSELHPGERFVGRHRGGREGSHNNAAQPKSCSEQQQLAKISVPGTALRDTQMFLGADSAANILQLREP